MWSRMASTRPSPSALWIAALPGARRAMTISRWPEATVDMVMDGLEKLVAEGDDHAVADVLQSFAKSDQPDQLLGGVLHAVQNAKSLDAAPVEVLAFFAEWSIAEVTGDARRFKNPAPP